MMYQRKLFLQAVPGRIGYNVFLYTERPDGSADVITGGNTAVNVKKGEPMPTTFYMEDISILQLFAEEAIGRGLKPKEGYTEGELIATKKHLEDMRIMLEIGKGV